MAAVWPLCRRCPVPSRPSSRVAQFQPACCLQMHDQRAAWAAAGPTRELALEAVEGAYLAAAHGALLGELRLEPLLVGLSDAYELCRWGGQGLHTAQGEQELPICASARSAAAGQQWLPCCLPPIRNLLPGRLPASQAD